MVKTFRRKHSTGNLSKKDADKTATAQLVVGWESERFKSSSHMETRQRDNSDALSSSSLRESLLSELPDVTSRMSPVQLHTSRMTEVRFLSGWTCQPRTSSTIPLSTPGGSFLGGSDFQRPTIPLCESPRNPGTVTPLEFICGARNRRIQWHLKS